MDGEARWNGSRRRRFKSSWVSRLDGGSKILDRGPRDSVRCKKKQINPLSMAACVLRNQGLVVVGELAAWPTSQSSKLLARSAVQEPRWPRALTRDLPIRVKSDMCLFDPTTPCFSITNTTDNIQHVFLETPASSLEVSIILHRRSRRGCRGCLGHEYWSQFLRPRQRLLAHIGYCICTVFTTSLDICFALRTISGDISCLKGPLYQDTRLITPMVQNSTSPPLTIDNHLSSFRTVRADEIRRDRPFTWSG